MTDVALSPEFLALWEQYLTLDPPIEELQRVYERYDAATLPLQRLVWQVIVQRMTVPPFANSLGRAAHRAATAEGRKRLLDAMIAALQEGRG